ncbi:MAG: protein TolR [Acidobacteria bacterium]|nr:MAG: protein TolR [Acidobacteriota bacterium]PYQ78773.1 MAG: protein TolR [Acidobacteriota bacterium]PYQ88269.1 MAG: protein TolR [Acidobacteriota bacterium]PYQ89861.1 MAG: protein TolR [Acidobacteriota bacterium]PYR12546.1 MAG: protein TolR [Acidobacteriota bacterium]
MPKVQTIPSAAPTRASRLRRVNVSLAEINVVPLVDVMLVLLIIFMVTAPMIQRGIDVNLPVAQRAQAISGERIEVIVPAEYRQNHIVYLGSDPIRKELLQERVRQKMETAAQKDVFLRGDSGVSLGEVVEVTDLLKAAGVEHVGLVTKSPNER